MDLKKLYRDVTVLLGKELPIYTFLTLCDTFARTLILRYPKNLIVGKGEYISPEGLDSSVALDEIFYSAFISFIIGSINGDKERLGQSDSEAERAYLTLWKRAALGKRIKNDRW